jgi:outer membrane receptor for ferrienterochelin and colicin
MAFFDLLENCSHPIFDEKPARLVSIAFARASQSARIAMVLIAAISFGSSAAIAQDKEDPRQKPSGVADLSLEQLMDVNIDTASKRWQKIVEAPASVSIVTADEIQKYGYRTLAEIRSAWGIALSNRERE